MLSVATAFALVLAGLAFVASPATAGQTTAEYLVRFTSGTSEAEQAAILSDSGAVQLSAIPQLRTYAAELDETAAATLQADSRVSSIDLDKVRTAEGTPDDPSYSDQWALPKIGWDSAFGVVDPAGTATVAVLDTGVDETADLTGKLVTGASMLDGVDGTADPNGHGTAMAGIVAARTDNSTGIAGVAYNGVSVMPVKVLGADGTGQDSDIVRGVVYAADHGADVILMAFSNPGRSDALQAAVDYAWSKGAVLVAATGNDGVSAATYPAGTAKVVGVSATDRDDNLWSGSNFGADAFLGAPGVDIASGSGSLTGTSASAAVVAASAAMVKANDPSATNGVVVGRLARNADPAGSADQTGNGRVNLYRALADTGTGAVVPDGVVGDGGPIVGPYVAAAVLKGTLQGQSNPVCSGGICPWETGGLSGWTELQTVPLRLSFDANQGGTSGTFTISIDHAAGGTAGLENLTNFAKSANVTVTNGLPGGVTLTETNGGDLWEYTFTASISGNSAGFVSFDTKLRAGAHAFTGNSLQVKGSGTLQFSKPAAAPGSPDLVLTKTASSAASPGQVLQYTLNYRNAAAGTGTTNQATGVQLTDNLPAGTTYVANSCTGSCVYDSLSNTLTWNVGTVAANSALVTRTYQVTVNSNLTNGATLTNAAQILSAENDANIANNSASVTTTVFAALISGTVIEDLDGDGAVDVGEPGLTGATVKLFKDANSNGSLDAVTTDPLVGTVTTPASGQWAFTSGLVKNTRYFVVRTNPSGYTSTNAVPESVALATDHSTAVKDGNDQLNVLFDNTNATQYSSDNAFLAHVANVAPTATVALSPTGPSTNQTVTATATKADADGNPVTLTYVWKVNGTVVKTTSGSSSLTDTLDLSVAGNGDRGDTVRVEVTPNDGTVDGTTVNDSVVVGNSAPTATVALSPTGPSTNQTVTATATKADADGNPVTLTYVWKVNGTVVKTTSASSSLTDSLDLSVAANGDGGDTVRVEVTPNDGTVNGTTVNDSVTVGNTAPTATVALSPTGPTTNQTVTATATKADADGNPVTLTYVWKVNGTVVKTTTASSSLTDTLDLSTSGNGDRGDVIRVEVTPNDGSVNGASVNDSVTVVNSAPSLTSVSITPATADTNTVLTATPNGYGDADSDTATFHYQWSNNGTPIAGATTSTLNLATPGNGDHGDTITVAVFATDGAGGTSPTQTASRAVSNTDPTLTSVSITPATADTNTVLTATPNGYGDADSDTATFHYQWSNNGTPIAGATTSTLNLATPGNGDHGDTITVAVFATDGAGGTSPTRSASRTVGNTDPTLTSVTITPATADTNTLLTATPNGYADLDGDSATFHFQWSKNGTPIAGATSSTLNLATSGNGGHGDLISVDVYATDGLGGSSPTRSDQLTVGNTDPTLDSVTITPATADTNSVLTATPNGYADADGDTATYHFQWSNNGTPIAGATSSTLNLAMSGNGDHGDTISVAVFATDGAGGTSPTRSASRAVGNTDPTLTSVTITPPSADTNSVLTATPNGYADADGDTATYHFQWSNNGTPIAGATGATLDLGADGNGDHGDAITVAVYATDGAGGTSPTRTASRAVDNTDPTLVSVTITPASAGTNTVLTATPNGFADADNDAATYHYQWSKNGTPIAGATNPTLDLGAADNGGHGDLISVAVHATDGFGGTSPTRTDQLTVGNSDPTLVSVTITPAAAGTNTVLTATPDGYADADGDTATYHYQWSKNGTPIAGATNPTLDLSAAGNGNRGDVISVAVHATDGFGGTSPTRSDQLTVGNTAPTMAAIDDKTVDELTALTFDADGADDDTPGDTLTYSLVGPDHGASIDSATGTFSWTPTEAQGPGDFAFTIAASDGSLSASRTFSVHVNEVNAAPAIGAIADKTVLEQTQLSFTASATDSDDPANTLAYSLVGAPAGASIDASTGAFTWTPTEAQGPADYTFSVKVTDNGTPVLEDSTPVTVHVTEANRAPSLGPVGDQTVDEQSLLSFTATATDPDLPANGLTFSLEGAPAGASIDSATGVFTWTPTEAQGPADYTFSVKVTDDGHPALMDTTSVKVHVNEVNRAPSIAAIGDKTVDEQSLLSFTATATDPDLPANGLTFSLEGAPAGASIDSATGVFTWTPTEAQGPADYTFTVKVTDGGSPALHDTTTVNVRVSEVNVAPALAAVGDKTVDEQALLSFAAIGSDSDLPANSLTYSLVGADHGASINSTTGVFSWTPSEAQGPGDFAFTIAVSDGSLNASQTFSVHVNEVNRAPALAVIADQTVDEQALLTFTASATDPDDPANTLAYSLVGAPAGASINSATGVFTWTPTEAQGPADYTFSVKVTDDGTPALDDTKSVKVHVNEVNRAPALIAIADQAVDEQSLLSFTASATDPDDPANTLAYSLVGAPAGASINATTGAFSWTPTEAQGPADYTFSVKVTDNGTPALDDTKSVKVHVNEVNRAPALTPIADKTVDEQALLSFTASATDPDLPANGLAYSLVGAPAGASINATTGAFTWTPTEAQGPADYTFTVKVTDNGSPAMNDTTSVKVHVNEVNRAPALTPIADKTVDEQAVLSFTAPATDPDDPANTLAYSLVGAPAGASIDASTGAFSWTPTEAQGPADYTFTVKVTDNGTPALSGTTTVLVHVVEVNRAPALAGIGDKTVDELAQLTFTATATDPDLPANGLNYSLVGAPAGASINATTGVFAWTPTEAQGPADYTFTVRVTDDGHPAMSDTRSVNVHVNEVNGAPSLAPIPSLTGYWGNGFAFTATATDADLPANSLTYSLVSPPAGASIDGSTGAFSWTPTAAQIGSATITVRVTDNGSPALSNEKTVQIAVGRRPTVLQYSGDLWGQYSDGATLTATLRDNGGGSMDGQPLAGKTVGFTVGTQSMSAATSAAGVASGSLTLTLPASTPGVTAGFSADSAYSGSSTTGAFEVRKEDATMEYTGDTLVSTGSTSTSSTARPSMSAVVTEAADGSLGSKLNTTQVRFTVYGYSDTAMSTPKASCTASVVTPVTYVGKGTVSCSLSAALTADNYIVKMDLITNPTLGSAGYYTAPTEDFAVTVVNSGTGFTTGGGWLNEPNLSSRSNFGFTVKYLKNGNVQGNSLYIYRRTLAAGAVANPSGGFLPAGSYNWIIKSNSMTGLYQNCTAASPPVCTATFTGKSTITAVNRLTGVAYSLGGNNSFQVDVTDNGEPGAKVAPMPDTYAIRVWDGSGTYYQLGTSTAQRPLDGGNVQVRP